MGYESLEEQKILEEYNKRTSEEYLSIFFHTVINSNFNLWD